MLLTAVKHSLAHAHERDRALKRGGNAAFVSLDHEPASWRNELETADHMTPEQAFEQRWAMATLENAMARLRQEYVRMEKGFVRRAQGLSLRERPPGAARGNRRPAGHQHHGGGRGHPSAASPLEHGYVAGHRAARRAPYLLEFSPTDPLLAYSEGGSVNLATGRVRLWNYATGARVGTWTNAGSRFAFTPDGKRLLTDNSEWLALWGIASGRLLRKSTLPFTALSIAMHPNLLGFAACSFQGEVRFFDLADLDVPKRRSPWAASRTHSTLR